MSLVVLKFGGTSVGSPQAMLQVCDIVHAAAARWGRVVVVTSAMGKSPDPKDQIKVTDALLTAARTAASGDGETYRRIRRELSAKHSAAVQTVVSDGDDRARISAEIEGLLDGFEMLCSSVRVLGEITPRALDAIAGLGERMAARILAGALRSRGQRAMSIDATEFVITNDHYQNAAPLMDVTRQMTAARLMPVLGQGVVPVVTGFIGSTPQGVPTTLGRGGSDYTASIVGAALNADEVLNFTDVNGVLTTDPRVAPDARTIEVLSQAEMSGLAFFGAQVLHPLTIAPLVDQQIPLRVKNTFNPDHPGTLITKQGVSGGSPVKAVTMLDQVCVVNVTGSGMRGVPGIAGRTFSGVARTGTSVYMFTQASSEQNICLVIPSAATSRVTDELEREFRAEISGGEIDAVTTFPEAAILTAVGNGIADTPGVGGRVCTALGEAGINILAIAQGMGECVISLVVDGRVARNAVRAVHALIR